jgi:hypothetical protein
MTQGKTTHTERREFSASEYIANENYTVLQLQLIIYYSTALSSLFSSCAAFHDRLVVKFSFCKK